MWGDVLWSWDASFSSWREAWSDQQSAEGERLLWNSAWPGWNTLAFFYTHIRMSLILGDIGTGGHYQAWAQFCGARKFGAVAKLPNWNSTMHGALFRPGPVWSVWCQVFSNQQIGATHVRSLPGSGKAWQISKVSPIEKKIKKSQFFQLRALASLYSGLTCLSCDFAFTTEHALLLHIGLKHR